MYSLVLVVESKCRVNQRLEKIVEDLEMKGLKGARLAMTRYFISLASCSMKSHDSTTGGSISADPVHEPTPNISAAIYRCGEETKSGDGWCRSRNTSDLREEVRP